MKGVLARVAVCGSAVALASIGGCKSRPWPGPTPPQTDPTESALVPEAVPAVAGPQGAAEPTAATTHPRLWIRQEDLPRLRAWAAAPDGVYSRGLENVAQNARDEMDKNGDLFKSPTCADDSGSYGCEEYAMIFAFQSLVSPAEAERADYAKRAKTLLMRMMNEADKGLDPKKTDDWRSLRGGGFSTGDRSRWMGEGFPLTVDWIYPSLSDQDKATIRRVFLRWCDENVHSSVTTSDHPEPIGMVNDPKLVSDRKAVRFAGNNYFAAHMRNIGLMSLAMDAKDDDGGKLRAYFRDATGAWLYLEDYLLHNDARGGLGPEGYEYGPQTLSYVMQFLLAITTAGEDRPATWGKQVSLGTDRFWDDALSVYVLMHGAVPVQHEWMGPVYQPVWFGEGQHYWAPDFIDLFGTIGVHAQLTKNPHRVDVARYIEMHFPPGGEAGWNERLAKEDNFRHAILDFLLFDPAAKVPDPHPTLPLTFFDEGIGHFFSKTSWSPDATFFSFNLGWISIDHQTADGLNFNLYRKGEWLTKRRVGYGDEISCSDSSNTISVENAMPYHHDKDDYRRAVWKRGSQYFNGDAIGDPTIVARSENDKLVYFLGDATNLYNSEHDEVRDVVHASRSIVWLKPDIVFLYDRATSKVDGRFKRFWMQLPRVARVAGNLATMTSAKGQKLYVTRLLPTDGVTTSAPAEKLDGEPADMEPMTARLETEVPSKPRDVRFLHVVEGADGAASPATLIQSNGAATFDGAVVKGVAILAPRVVGAVTGDLVYSVPNDVHASVVTGLTPNGGYDVSSAPDASGHTVVTVRPGSAKKADSGGVLSF